MAHFRVISSEIESMVRDKFNDKLSSIRKPCCHNFVHSKNHLIVKLGFYRFNNTLKRTCNN